jgi:hypothetical protein
MTSYVRESGYGPIANHARLISMRNRKVEKGEPLEYSGLKKQRNAWRILLQKHLT